MKTTATSNALGAAAVGVAVAAAVMHLRPRRDVEGWAASNEGLAPRKFRSQGRTHYYQVPANPRGTLLVMPGCARWGPGFWPYDPRACPECTGLTEDVCHTKQALARGYAVLVAWPVDRAFPGQYCWSSGDDGRQLVQVLEEFVAAHGLADKPVYAMGASSGGRLALLLPGLVQAHGTRGLRVEGVLAQVSSNTEVAEVVRGLRRFPPIVWVAMGDDPGRGEAARVRQRVAQYSRHGRAAMAVSPPRPVTPTYFSDRHPDISPAQSAQLAGALRDAGLVDARGAFVAEFKKNKAWVGKLRRRLPWLRDSPAYALGPTKASAILQAMLVAEGRHEHVCDYLTAALAWFEQGGAPPFEALVAAHRVDKPALLTMARQAVG
jgi:hypothetical protein